MKISEIYSNKEALAGQQVQVAGFLIQNSRQRDLWYISDQQKEPGPETTTIRLISFAEHVTNYSLDRSTLSTEFLQTWEQTAQKETSIQEAKANLMAFLDYPRSSIKTYFFDIDENKGKNEAEFFFQTGTEEAFTRLLDRLDGSNAYTLSERIAVAYPRSNYTIDINTINTHQFFRPYRLYEFGQITGTLVILDDGEPGLQDVNSFVMEHPEYTLYVDQRLARLDQDNTVSILDILANPLNYVDQQVSLYGYLIGYQAYDEPMLRFQESHKSALNYHFSILPNEGYYQFPFSRQNRNDLYFKLQSRSLISQIIKHVPSTTPSVVMPFEYTGSIRLLGTIQPLENENGQFQITHVEYAALQTPHVIYEWNRNQLD